MKRKSKRSRNIQRNVNDFTNRLGVSPLGLAILVALLIGIGGLIWVIAFQDRNTGSSARNLEAIRNNLNQRISVDKQLLDLQDTSTDTNLDFVFVIEDLRQRLKTLDRIVDSFELTEEQETTADMIRIGASGRLTLQLIKNGLECEAEKAELRKVCLSSANHDDKSIWEAAHFWLAAIPVWEFANEPNEDSFRTLTEFAGKYNKGYLENKQNAGIVFNLMLKMLDNKKPKAFIDKGYAFMRSQFEQSEQEGIRKLSQSLTEYAIYGEFRLGSLSDRIAWGEPGVQADIDGALTAFEQHPDETSFETWATIFEAYESFLATDDFEATGSSWKKMSAIVDALPDTKRREQMKACLERQKLRAMRIGEAFNVTGSQFPDDQPITESNHQYTLVLFCNKQAKSKNVIIGLRNKLENRSKQLFRPIVVMDEDFIDADYQIADDIREEIIIASRKTALRYKQYFPVDFHPYLVLLDRDGKMLSANLKLDQVANRIAEREADRRKAKQGIGSGTQPNPASELSQYRTADATRLSFQ